MGFTFALALAGELPLASEAPQFNEYAPFCADQFQSAVQHAKAPCSLSSKLSFRYVLPHACEDGCFCASIVVLASPTLSAAIPLWCMQETWEVKNCERQGAHLPP